MLNDHYETPRREKSLLHTHTHKYTFIQTLFLSIYCMPYTEDTGVNKTDNNPCLWGADSLW